ncbi:LytR/AlgR family response regulator transcription factor [Peptacetobacter sp.]|uniref:LytR/AlgR family response regulator transcription factor n=1 Tax=Peptacetobacter sp. TaxID=2991975 RepID=UPI00262EDC12|nr:LytTR family DNA-binding domain-containing protein [Peptacetobacter sp.]
MISIAICEDEKIYRDKLKEFLKKILEQKKYNVEEFDNGESFLDRFESDESYRENLNIVLLDIQMDGINGMDVARKIREWNKKLKIIFITAVPDFLADGYEVKAFRYLLKPIGYEDFCRHFGKCLEEIMDNKESSIVINDLNTDKIVVVPTESILFVETYGRNLLVHTEKNVYKIYKTIGSMEKKLDSDTFFRLHRGYIVNISRIESIKGRTAIVAGNEVMISRDKIKELKERVMDYIEKVMR